MTPFARSLARTQTILARQLQRGSVTRAWELELARMLELAIPDRPLDDLARFWTHSVAATPFPDGIGPWGRHDVWGEESYGIGHTRNFVRVLADAEYPIARADDVTLWIRAMQRGDGRFACQEDFERLYRARHPEEAARRDAATRAAWQYALGPDAPATALWAHSDLEDAWNALDTIETLGSAPADVDRAVAWLRSRQRPDGAFRSRLALDGDGDAYGSALADTMYAVRALATCDATPDNAIACITWLLVTPIVPTLAAEWARIEAIHALGALDLVGPSARDRWQQAEFSEDEAALQVSFDAYAAIRTQRLGAE
jgi:hypothetical protein